MKIGLTQHRFGVNYTPTRQWWYCWNDFEPAAIARDLDAIAALEADHIRIMLIWPYFQPNPRAVSGVHLQRLGVLMDLARARGLDVCVSAVVGWLSGYGFRQTFRGPDIFRDAEAQAALERFFVALAETLNACENFLGFDLGNEINCCWQAPDVTVGDAWHARFLGLAQRLSPGRIHVNGVDHQPWFQSGTFSPQALARSQQIVAVHGWTHFTGAIEQAGGDVFGDACLDLLAGMTALARAYAGDAAKPVWIQEYGMSEDWLAARDIPRFLTETTQRGIAGGAAWFTWWASHDLDRGLAFDPLEYSLGLIGHDNRIKPQGEAFRELARAYRGRDVKLGAVALRQPPASHDAVTTWRWLRTPG